MNRPKTYLRPIGRWWLKTPYYRQYMLREATCIVVAGYALVLLAGLWCLAEGRAEFDAWRAALSSPWSIAIHTVALAAMLYHAWTWFAVMPKTLPFLRINEARISDTAIVRSAVLASIAASVLLFVVAFLAWR